MKNQLSLIFCFLFLIIKSNGQTIHKTLEAKRTAQPVKIDAVLDEPAWADAAHATDFVEFRPTSGKLWAQGDHTEAFLMYSDAGIYFGGTCYESDLNNITKELAGRDGFGANDYIGIIFDTYNDKLNGFEYFVTPLNEQWDAKMAQNNNVSNNGGEDFGWNAVWQSAVKIHEKGWTFEVFLPYGAIRFGKDKVQDWGLNITRRRRKTEQQNCWSPIDIKRNGFLPQEGTWAGIKDIKPPIRLQLYPYFSYYKNHFPQHTANLNDWSSQISGGLDLKLGLSQSFTLDATLIPDFGQVQSDNRVLNLTPFEVRYNENRQFFTEGTELFSKGNLFYSRRIGGTPLHYDDASINLAEGEEMLKNPSESKLINATKISGRTQKGLGIGILNAITKTQYATIVNKTLGTSRQIKTDPSTNYNIAVLDQTLKYNSSVSFINANVTRAGTDYNSNVNSGIFNFNNKTNTYNYKGKFSWSHFNYKNEPDTENTDGYSHSLGMSKTSGKFIFQLQEDLSDKKYNSNDLGYFTNNNFFTHWAYMGLRFLTPKNWYNRMNFNMYMEHNKLFKPFDGISETFQNGVIRANFNAQTKGVKFFGIFADVRPKSNDFYEPRQSGYIYKRGASMGNGVYFGSNEANKYSINLEYFQRRFFNFYQLKYNEINIMNNVRFNSKFTVNHNISFENAPRGLGFTALIDNQTIMALRKINTVNNVLNLKYNFTNKMGLNLRTRHYLSKVKNLSFFDLAKNGSLIKTAPLDDSYNKNVNYFNVDMVYTWQFAPGSFMNLVWKNATNYTDNAPENGYFESLDNTLNSDQNNNFSLKVIYFLDYLQLKKS